MIMAATMDPKPKQLQQNVVLNFRNLKVTRKNKLSVKAKLVLYWV